MLLLSKLVSLDLPHICHSCCLFILLYAVNLVYILYLLKLVSWSRGIWGFIQSRLKLYTMTKPRFLLPYNSAFYCPPVLPIIVEMFVYQLFVRLTTPLYQLQQNDSSKDASQVKIPIKIIQMDSQGMSGFSDLALALLE